MTDLIERLLDKQHLRATHGLTGWVLAVESLHSEAADEIKRLTAERDELRAAVEALVPIVQRDSELIGECDEYRAERDAALRLADEAMGNDVEREV